jgi:hypothetical protein
MVRVSMPVVGAGDVQHELQAMTVVLGGVPDSGGGVEAAALCRADREDVQGRYQVVDRACGRCDNGDITIDEVCPQMREQRPR